MERDKVHELSHGTIELTQHADDKIESLRYYDPQDDKTLMARTGKQPVLKVGTLHNGFIED